MASIVPVEKPAQPKETPTESREVTAFKKSTVKRIKHLFLIFLRQFDVSEFEIMVKFLRVLLSKYKKDPLKIFEYLTNNRESLIPLPKVPVKSEKLPEKSAAEDKPTNETPAATKTPSTTRKDDDESCIYIDDEQLLNKSDIIKSFAANSDVGADNISVLLKKNGDRAHSDIDEEDDVSVSSFGSSLDDYNYYNSRLFDDDDEDENDERNGGESELGDEDEEVDVDDEFKFSGRGATHQNGHKSNGIKSRRRRSRRTQRFSDDIEDELERNFAQNPTLTSLHRRKLAKKLRLSEAQVQRWFVERKSGKSSKEAPIEGAVSATTTKKESVDSANVTTDNTEQVVGDQQQQTSDGAKKKGRGRPPKKKIFYEMRVVYDEPVITKSNNTTVNQQEDDKENLNGDIKEEKSETRLDETGSVASESQSSERKAEEEEAKNVSGLLPESRRSGGVNPRRKSLLEKQKRREEEAAAATAASSSNRSTRAGLRRRRESSLTADDSSVTDTSQSAKRACLGGNYQRRGFPPAIVAILEKAFHDNNYPSDDAFISISDESGLTDKQVKSWFSQRRHRQKNGSGEKTTTTTSGAASSTSSKGEDEPVVNDDENEEEPGCLEIDDERSVSSGGSEGPVRSTSSTATSASSSSTTANGADSAQPPNFPKQIEQELEKHAKKLKYCIEPQEKKNLATKLGIKLNDLDRWLLIKRST